MGECTFSSLEEIRDAFSVEKVTNEFFNGFRTILEKTQKEFEEANKYTACSWLKSKYEPEDYQEQVKSFNLTFLGRIIFLYFLLRKGWIEDRSDYIRKIFEDRTRHNLYQEVLQPLKVTNTLGNYDADINVSGGGFTGQAGAIKLGIARALVHYNEDHRSPLRKEGLMSRDPSAVERKKCGQPKARKKFQFSKR